MKKNINVKLFLLLLILSCTFAVYAEDYQEEDVIVVSSSKLDQNIDLSVEKVNVVSDEELEKKGAKTLADALRSLPGLVVTNSVLKNKSSSIMIQGFEGQYVKILIDGVALSAENAGAVYLERIPLENIDHIEIIQGASSALYGSDALGGIVNIITKKSFAEAENENEEAGVKLSGHLAEDFASSLQNKVSLGGAVAVKRFSAGVNTSFDWHKGLEEMLSAEKIGSVNETKTPASRLWYADANLAWKGDSWNVGLDGIFSDYLRKTTNIGTSRGSVYVSKNDYSELRLLGTLRGEKTFSDELSLKAFASAKNYEVKLDEEKLYSKSAATDSEAKVGGLESEVQFSWLPNLYNSVVFGLNGNFESGSGSSFENTKTNALLSLFAQDNVDFSAGEESFILGLGGRFDFQPGLDESKMLFQATPKLSIKYNPLASTALRFSYGMGYKLPSLNQKYFVKYHSHGNTGFYIYGNKNLKPEISHGFNLNLEQKLFSSCVISAAAFFNLQKNMIDTHKIEEADSYYYQYENLDKGMTFGASLGLSGKTERSNFYINYSYTAAKSIKDEAYTDLTYRIPHRIAAGFSYMIPKVELLLSFDGEWNAPQIVSEDGSQKSPDLLLLNASINKKLLDDKIEFYLRGENLLNNLHFVKGSNEENQKEFFSLYEGIVLHLGTRIKL